MIIQQTCQNFIEKLPKAELHVHIEGTMGPHQLILFAQRNSIQVPNYSIDENNGKYIFSDCASFIQTYKRVSTVVKYEIDFYELMIGYLKKVAQQGVMHAEIFFDLQSYAERSIVPAVIVNGLYQGLKDGERLFGITGGLIMCFLRECDESDAFKTLKVIKTYRDKIIGVGLAGLESGNPPTKFERVFAAARAEGYRVVAHAGEGSYEYIEQTLSMLHVERVDHGFTCMHDLSLVRTLVELQIPLTICPLSNVALGYYKRIADHPLKKLFDAGLNVSIHSDDPAFFGGYIVDNYRVVHEQLNFSCKELVRVARNSFSSSFLDLSKKQICYEKLNEYCVENVCMCL